MPTNTNLRGVLFMVAAMAAFIINDTFLKLATERLPAFEALFFRSVFAFGWGALLMVVTGTARHVLKVFDRRVMFRSLMELVAVLGFIIGLANASIADMTALSQLAPVLVVLGAAVVLKLRVTWLQVVLSLVACAGAVMVAQPGTSGFSPYALFGIWNAVIIAVRELSGRTIPTDIPGTVVAFGTAILVLIATAVIGPLTETWVWPDAEVLWMIAGSGLFLILAHFSVFTSYRIAEPGLVAPFSYTSTVFALVSAMVIFGTLPNWLALTGIAVIVVCGVALMLSEGRKDRRTKVERALPPAG